MSAAEALRPYDSDVPVGWQPVELGDVAAVNPDTLRASTSADYSFGYIDISQIDGPGQCSGWTEITFSEAPSRARRKVQAHDILVSTVRPYLRSFAQVPEAPLPLVASTGFAVVRAEQNADQQFLYQHILHGSFIDHLTPRMTGSNYPAVSAGDVAAYPLLLPPLDEQRRIAEVLRSVDEAIAATQGTVQAAANVRQVALDAMIQRVLDDAETVVLPLCDVAEVRTGLAKNKNRAGPKVLMPYLRVANVQDGWIDVADMQEIEVDPAQVDRYLLLPGDVLLTEGGDYDKLGRGGIWKGEIAPCLHQNHVFCVRPHRSALVPEYFALATQSAWGRAYFLSCAKRTTNLASINSSQLRAFPVPAISVAKQVELIEEIEGIDAMIELEERQLDTLLRLRSEVSSDLLSGHVRVPA